MFIDLLEYILEGLEESEAVAFDRLGYAMQAAFHLGCAVGTRRKDENLQLENCLYDTETGQLSFSLCSPDGDSGSGDTQTGDTIH